MLTLSRIQDFRSPLHKLSRKELEYLARKENREDIKPGMPADIIRRRFIENPPSQLPRPIKTTLGSQTAMRVPRYEEWLKIAFFNGVHPEPPRMVIQEVKAEDELERQWREQAKPLAEKKTVESKPINEMAELRKAVKAKGITAPRTATKDALRALLNGEDTP